MAVERTVGVARSAALADEVALRASLTAAEIFLLATSVTNSLCHLALPLCRRSRCMNKIALIWGPDFSVTPWITGLSTASSHRTKIGTIWPSALILEDLHLDTAAAPPCDFCMRRAAVVTPTALLLSAYDVGHGALHSSMITAAQTSSLVQINYPSIEHGQHSPAHGF